MTSLTGLTVEAASPDAEKDAVQFEKPQAEEFDWGAADSSSNQNGSDSSNGTSTDGAKQNATSTDGAKQNATSTDGAKQNATSTDGAKQNATSTDGAKQNATSSNTTSTDGAKQNATSSNTTSTKLSPTSNSTNSTSTPPAETTSNATPLPLNEPWVSNSTFIRFDHTPELDFAITYGGDRHPLEKWGDKRYQALSKADELTRKRFLSSLTLTTTGPGVTNTSALPNRCKTPNSVVLQQWQSRIKNQHARVMATAFTGVAALEAAYARTKGRKVLLSEQFVNWAMLTTSFRRVRSKGKRHTRCSLWGGGNVHEVADAMQYYGAPRSKVTPFMDEHEMMGLVEEIKGTGSLPERDATQPMIDNFEYAPEYISRHMKDKARFSVTEHVKLTRDDVRNTCKMERILSNNFEVMVDFKLNWKQVNGTMNYDSRRKHRGGFHSMLVVGYDKHAGVFLCKNSWGGRQYTRVSYLFMQRAALAGSVILKVSNPHGRASFFKKTRLSFLGRWNADLNGERGTVMIRRVHPEAGIGTYTTTKPDGSPRRPRRVRGHWLHSEDNRALVMSIGRRRYKLYIHENGEKYISGVRKNAYLGGAILSRKVLPLVPRQERGFSRTRDLQGSWTVRADGLKVASFKLGKVAAGKSNHGTTRRIRTQFQDSRRVNRFATGVLMYKGPYRMDGRSLKITVNMALGTTPWMQVYHLFYHTREKDIMSGYTRDQDGNIVPVFAIRRTKQTVAWW